ncbi:MAG: AAA family ATPase [Coriobacteriia bacterium]
MGLITVIDPSGSFAGIVGTLCGGHPDASIEAVGTFDSASFDGTWPYVIVAAPEVLPSAAMDAAMAAEAAGAHTAVVMVAPEVTTELMRAAMKTGVCDVVAMTDSAAEISRAILDAYDSARRRAEAAISEIPAVAPDARGQVVSVFSTKGGVGKTVLATNLGVALAKVLDLKTALVDLDLQFGDVGIMLGMTPERTITDVASSIERLDVDLLRGHMTTHESGLDVLLAPVRPEDAETVTTGRIGRILSLLSEMYDVVVIDTAATFDEVVLTAIDRSNAVYAVTMMDVASIKNMRISRQKLTQLGYDDDLMRVVLNRADSKVWLQPQEVERAVGSEIFAKIPSDRMVPRSVNKGVPVVLDEPRSDVAKAMVGIARTIAASAQEVSSDVA